MSLLSLEGDGTVQKYLVGMAVNRQDSSWRRLEKILATNRIGAVSPVPSDGEYCPGCYSRDCIWEYMVAYRLPSCSTNRKGSFPESLGDG